MMIMMMVMMIIIIINIIIMQRFTDTTSGTPAPGAYNDPREALESLKRISGLKRSPFGQTDVRFKLAHGTGTPGK